MPADFISIVNRTYLGKLFAGDKLLFVIVTGFFILNILANLIKLETTPFFIWNVYAHRQAPLQDHSFYELRYNDGKLLSFPHTWQEPQKMMLFDPLRYYTARCTEHIVMDQSDHLTRRWAAKHPAFRPVVTRLINDTLRMQAFPAWYKRYLASQTAESIDTIYVLKKVLYFTGDGSLRERSSDTSIIIH